MAIGILSISIDKVLMHVKLYNIDIIPLCNGMVVHVVEKLKKKGKKAKQLLENIEKNITELQKGKQELKYDIEEFYAKLTAAGIRQKYKVYTQPLYLIIN